MPPLKHPYNILHFINILLSPNIYAFWDMETFLHSHPIFSALLNLTFLTLETQKCKFHKFLPHALSPTHLNQKSLKDPKSILILTMKLLYTYFWKSLPIGALIWLAPIWLIWAQIAQPTSNHLKTETSRQLSLTFDQSLSELRLRWRKLPNCETEKNHTKSYGTKKNFSSFLDFCLEAVPVIFSHFSSVLKLGIWNSNPIWTEAIFAFSSLG